MFTRTATAARRSLGLLGVASRGVVGDAQEQGEEHVVGDQRRAAVGDERQGDAGERQQPGDAADDDERLHAEQRGEPGGEQLLERRLGPHGDAQAGADQQQEGDEHGGGAEQAELLADGGEDEVGLDDRDAGRVAEPEPGAGHAAPGHGEPGPG